MKLRHDMLVHGVYIITACHEEKLGGLAVAWGMQIGTDSFLICVGKQSATRDLILSSQAFGLNILRADQVALGNWFGRQSSRNVAKFDGVPYFPGINGAPILEDCAAAFSCEVSDVFDRGTQKLIAGRVLQAEKLLESQTLLIYCEEDYPGEKPAHPYLQPKA